MGNTYKVNSRLCVGALRIVGLAYVEKRVNGYQRAIPKKLMEDFAHLVLALRFAGPNTVGHGGEPAPSGPIIFESDVSISIKKQDRDGAVRGNPTAKQSVRECTVHTVHNISHSALLVHGGEGRRPSPSNQNLCV